MEGEDNNEEVNNQPDNQDDDQNNQGSLAIILWRNNVV